MLFGTCLVFAKEGMFSYTVVTKKINALYDPEAVEAVLSSNTVLQKGYLYALIKPLLKDGLITSSGSKWHSRRKLLTPAFHFKILDQFIPVFNKHAKIFVKRTEDSIEKEEIFDILPLTRCCTLDVILETAIGKRTISEDPEVKEYRRALDTWCKCLSIRITSPWLYSDFIFHRTETGRISRKCLNVIHHFTRQVISDLLQEKLEKLKDLRDNGVTPTGNDINRTSKQQLALLDLLLDLHIQDKNSLSLKDIADEVDTFVFAGHDSTSTAISWTLYLLGLHQDIQRDVQEELDIVLGDDVDRMITSEDVRKLKYLSCVVKETLRLYPVFPLVMRNADEDIIIRGETVRKGETIIIPIYMVHRNPEIFPNPEVFDPQRFNPNMSRNRHPFAYIPFSAGPRNCIGQRFATYEINIILATVLRHFNVTSIEHRDKMKLLTGLILTTENGLHLKFTRRHHLTSYRN